MTRSEYVHLRVCGTCSQWQVGLSNCYCDIKVPDTCRDDYGVMDWTLPVAAICDPHDYCEAWDEWT